jgi:hypothetical protein
VVGSLHAFYGEEKSGQIMPIFMKVSGLTGPATGKYAGWFELQSFTFASESAANEASASRKADRHSLDLEVELIQANRHDITIDLTKADPLRTPMFGAVFNSYQTSGGVEGQATEYFSFTYSSVTQSRHSAAATH